MVPYPLQESDFQSDFVRQNLMGPSALRIVEELTAGLALPAGARILDLGCGKGLTSLFLAQKYRATVFAVDLWISATENLQRFQTQTAANVVPLHAEAHALPFAEGYFDAIVSVDAYHYFGTEPGYLAHHLLPLLKPEGKVLVAVPGLKEEFVQGVPEELLPFWQEDMNFHGWPWWKALWEAESNLTVAAWELGCLGEAWADWLACDNPHARDDIALCEAEGGRYFNLVALGGTRSPQVNQDHEAARPPVVTRITTRLEELNLTFSQPPLVIGGMAMEYYGMRKAGADIDLVISTQDYDVLCAVYPENRKDIWGDLGLVIGEFEIWRSIALLDYDYLEKEAVVEGGVLLVSLDRLLLMRVCAMDVEKYRHDLVTMREYYYSRFRNPRFVGEMEAHRVSYETLGGTIFGGRYSTSAEKSP